MKPKAVRQPPNIGLSSGICTDWFFTAKVSLAWPGGPGGFLGYPALECNFKDLTLGTR